MPERDEFYQDIIAGLAVYFDSSFVSDVLGTAQRYPRPDLGHALNRNQTASKKWLLDALLGAAGERLGVVYVLGAWYGVLPAMLLHDSRFRIDHVVSVDIDPACAPIAECLNRCHAADGRFSTLSADMRGLRFNGGADTPESAADVVVNTSCEHMAGLGEWFADLPDGLLLVLQSNDYVDCDEHVNCVPDLAAFKEQVPLSQVLFEGQLRLKKYTRFMLIGRK